MIQDGHMSASVSSPSSDLESNPESALSRETSVISSSSSSSSILKAPVPVRNYAASGSGSSSPSYGPLSRPPPWLSRHFRRGSTDLSTEQAPPAKTTPSPDPSIGVRHRMSSPDDFEFGEELGGGSWSTVVEVIHPPTSKRYAIKVLNKAQLVKEKMTQYAVVEKNALAILSSGNHPGIVRLYSAFHDSTSLYLVLSLAPNGDLRELVKKIGSLSLSCARYYTAQVVDTVLWMHGKGILHRDLKPENILLDHDMRIKLADFGSAYISKDLDLSPRTSTFVGTAAYVSPELLSGSKTTSQSSDIWAIGCILYFLMVGQSPFLALNDYLSFKKIEALDYSFLEGFDSDARDLVQRLLVLDPSDRLGVPSKSSPSELREHSFFVGHRSSTLEAHPTSYINWDTLWSDPPVTIEPGLVRVAPRERPEENALFSWGGFIKDFSLVADDDESEASPLDGQNQEKHAEDVLAYPSTTNGESRVSPLRSNSTPTSPTASSPSLPSTTAAHDRTPNPDVTSRSPTSDINLLGSIDSWSSILIPSETVHLVTQVEMRSRHRLIQKTQHRLLVLTSLPRVLCVKHQKNNTATLTRATSHRLIVKDVLTLPIGGGGVVTDPQTRNQIVGANIRGERAFALDTPGKCHVFTTPNKAEASRWVKEIQALVTPSPPS